MSFQWIINNAEQLSINRLDVVAQTQSRDGTVRAISRGSSPKKFTVTLPAGPAYSEYKSLIEGAEALGRHTSADITIPFSRFSWYYADVQPQDDEEYTVICTVFPQWTIFQRNQIRWSGPFEFVEVL